ncbi:hypothetical protein ACYSNX_02895 [Myroides sp. LJL115]
MKNFIKKTVLGFCVALLGLFVVLSCSKDDDPVNNDLFVGKYTGKVTYDFGDKHINTSNGNVEVIKVGKNYNFLFSNDIPDLTGVEFEKDGENVVINIDSDQAHYIRIDQSTLVIAFTKDGRFWTADCVR